MRALITGAPKQACYICPVLFGLTKLRNVFVWKELRNSTDQSKLNTQGGNKLPMVQVRDEIALHGMLRKASKRMRILYIQTSCDPADIKEGLCT